MASIIARIMHEKGQSPYNIVCDCRKPEPGMLLQAIREYQHRSGAKSDAG